MAQNTAPRKSNRRAGGKDRSTRHYTVDVFRADHLAATHPELSPVEIREVFEDEPVKRAIGLILWAKRKAPRNPYRKLKDWARRNERGFYNPAVRKRDPHEDRRQYMAYLEKKRAEKQRSVGRAELLPSEVLSLTEEFHAPAYRADLASVDKEADIQRRMR